MELMREDDGRVSFTIRNVFIQNTPHTHCLNVSQSRNISEIVKYSKNFYKVSSLKSLLFYKVRLLLCFAMVPDPIS